MCPPPKKKLNPKPLCRFRHLLGTDAKPDQCYQDLRPSTAGSETNIIKCSSLFWAIPWAGAGGSVFVRKWDAVGRVEPMPHMLQGHKVQRFVVTILQCNSAFCV